MALIAFYKRNQDLNKENIQYVIDGLIKAENSVNVSDGLRVAVGFGSCVDIITPAMSAIEELNLTHPTNPEIIDDITDLDDFSSVFSYYFKYGAAAELFTKNKELLKKLVKVAKKNPQTREKIGGNALVMVKNFLKLGYKVLLGAQMSEDMKKKMDPEVLLAGQNVKEDDVHLIFEYEKGQKWGDFEAPRANRFILHNDHNNPLLSSLEQFQQQLPSFHPHLVVVGGLQMLDNFPFLPGQRRERLERLGGVLSELEQDTRVHFEMAHFSEKECLEDILQTIAPHCDSFGMNEQELPNLLGLLLNDSITIVSEPVPRIAATLDKMRMLFNQLREHPTHNDNSTLPPHGRISRLHVHTLAFQVIMTEVGSRWKNSLEAAARASLTAHRHTCGSDHISVDRSRLLMDDSFAITMEEGATRIMVNPEEPVTCWTESQIEVCLAPVVVCTRVAQTVGGGDHISSSGLVVQI